MSDETLEIRPNRVQRGSTILVTGSGWPADALVITIDNEVQSSATVLRGSLWNGHLVPDAAGHFLLRLATPSLLPGKYTLRVKSLDGNARAEERLIIDERVRDPKASRDKLDKPFLRADVFKSRRLGKRATWPAGAIDAAKRDLGRIIPFVAPIPGVCNWRPLGPAPFSEGKTSSFGDNSGRIRSLAVDPVTPSRLYAGTASAGVWRSTDSGSTWSPRTDDRFSLAIGALAVDPTSPNIVYAGTGEYVPGSDAGAYYGNGLYRSADFGDTWSDLGTSQFYLAEIARIVVNPSNNANLFVAASNGLWESLSSGTSWTQLSANPCTDVVLVQKPSEPGTRRLVAAFSTLGVYASANSGSGWSAFSAISVPGAPSGSRNIVLGACRTQPNVIYAAFCEGGSGGNMLAHVAKSSDWGASWIARTIPSSGRLYQAAYNLFIQPDPTLADTVILGVVDVFKSVDGGGSWNPVTFGTGAGPGVAVHPDQHAIAFHPTTANALYVGCDGGLFFSPDSCATWKSCNNDLASLQLYDLGQHPQYEAIMIAGSQDNGGFHYSGAPIWRRTWVRSGVAHNDMGGDVVAVRIDPFNPYVHYFASGAAGQSFRSDDAGKFFTTWWANFPATEWLIPFDTDPHTAGVVWTGGRRVQRSIDRGTSWVEVTGDLNGSLRSIAFHPTDAHVVFAGTNNGHVYRLTGPPAGVWNATTVTTDDITHSGLPSGLGISSIAADTAGQVWVTLSDLMHTEATGEFTNDHVWRLDSGAGAWVSKSNGLAIANPINTIVADPLDTTKLYCGGDRAVFKWNAATQQWSAMDEGLPNVAINKLMIHQPSRMLRAATYGRGAWERSLDGPCSDYFLYLRDNLVDAGRTPSPDGVPHPYVAGENCYHWQSPDIVVDSTSQTPSAVTSAIELYDKVEHDGAHRGVNRVYVTLHNKGPFAVTNARVRAFFAAASAGLPAFPAGLLADPFSWIPSGASAWNPVGTVFAAGTLPPGTTRLAHWDSFVIPSSAAQHSCLLAFVTSDEDPFNSGGITDPDQLVVQNRKVALKNLDLDAIPGPGGSLPGGMQTPEGSTVPHEIALHSNDRQGALYSVALVAVNLPPQTLLVAALDKTSRKTARVADVKLSKSLARRVSAFARFKQPRHLGGYDVGYPIIREPQPHAATPLADVVLSTETSARLVVWMQSEKWDAGETYGYDVVQMRGTTVTGGYSVRFVAKR